MKKLKNEIIENPHYADFIRQNREILSGINSKVLEDLAHVKNNIIILSRTIDDLIKQADISITMHRQYKNSTGDEEIFKLKALLLKLKKNSMADSIHAESALYLAAKIDNIINNSFTEIDPLEKEKKEAAVTAEPAPAELKYKWFTFCRNGSWFIRGYDIINIYGVDKDHINLRQGRYYYEISGKEYEIIDLMNPHPDEINPPVYLLAFDSPDHLYASDENGREIHASSDIVSPQIRQLKNHDSSGYIGRIRLFGTNYLLPAPEKSER